MQIEFATAADLDAMAGLLGELFALEADFTPDRAKQLGALRWILDHPAHGRLFVLRDEGRVVGMANALVSISTAEGGPVLILEDVVLAASHRGGGHGRRLVEHVLAWAAAEGMPRVTLLADKDNAAALAFYERLGFEESAMAVRRLKL
ncbi:MAG: GCN5-related N-acetyltransferase [Rhodocyclaceae bacterium]|nr:MAG: GCN5-related N-acetyltransferase [Rhodocyclaceae bacterium]TNC99095.1 MAG: GCN5-related N-acetyltransferase [Rhodocyclaceae bacterium]